MNKAQLIDALINTNNQVKAVIDTLQSAVTGNETLIVEAQAESDTETADA